MVLSLIIFLQEIDCVMRKNKKVSIFFLCVVVVVTFDRKHWLQGLSSNDVVIGLLLANTGVFLMWRVFDQRFMMNNFMVSPQKILHLYRHVLF